MFNLKSKRFVEIFAFLFLAVIFAVSGARAQSSDQIIYDDALQNSWENWSWAQVNLNNNNPVHGGAASASVSAAAWQAIYFHHPAFSTSGYTHLNLWLHGGNSGGQQLQLQAIVNNAPQTAYVLPVPAANSWREITIPLSALGVQSSVVEGFWIQDLSGATQPVFYVDDIKLIGGTPPPQSEITLQIDAAANRHAISPLIYGTAYATTAQLLELNAPLNRQGGNNTSRYNWQLNADNRANDFYFESIPFANAAGEVGDSFIQTSKEGGAFPMLTVPIIDWIAKVGVNRTKLASFSINKYGEQTDRDWQYFPDAGNGVKLNGQFVTGNDPNDANVPNSVAFQQGWVQHLVTRWGTASGNGLKYYILDNEHSIWHSTHRDVHSVGATMEETYGKMRDYAQMIKSIDASAQTLGPEEWGWDGFRYSGYDQQYAPTHNWTFPDREAHNNLDYVAWLLLQFKNYEQTNGQRLLDIFTLHYYPQGGEFGNDVSGAMQLRRNRSTRSLWDENYTDESWINDKVKLIPRMKSWVTDFYPNTKIGITEYNWGAENNINGATAQADIYGIFGREGLYMANRWTTPDASTPTFKAMKMYRNYDGSNSGFGETSVAASAPNPDNLSTFAAVRASDGALTVMVINKIASAAPISVHIANFSASAAAQVWQLTSANQIARISDAAVTSNVITTSVPGQSITLFVIAPANATAPTAPANLSGSVRLRKVTLDWQDKSGDEDGFIIERAFGNLTAGATTAFTEVGRAPANQTSWQHSSKPGNFVYRVRAFRANLNSEPSNLINVRFR